MGSVVASELRGDRIHHIVSRMRALDAPPNLAVLGGDARIALRHHTRRKSLHALYVNFPEYAHPSGSAPRDARHTPHTALASSHTERVAAFPLCPPSARAQAAARARRW